MVYQDSQQPWRLFDQFAGFVIQRPDVNLDQLLNWFLRGKRQSDVEFIEEHFSLIMQCGRAARAAPKQIQEKIVEKERKGR